MTKTKLLMTAATCAIASPLLLAGAAWADPCKVEMIGLTDGKLPDNALVLSVTIPAEQQAAAGRTGNVVVSAGRPEGNGNVVVAAGRPEGNNNVVVSGGRPEGSGNVVVAAGRPEGNGNVVVSGGRPEGSGNIVVSGARPGGPGPGALIVSISGSEACDLKLAVTPQAK